MTLIPIQLKENSKRFLIKWLLILVMITIIATCSSPPEVANQPSLSPSISADNGQSLLNPTQNTHIIASPIVDIESQEAAENNQSNNKHENDEIPNQIYHNTQEEAPTPTLNSTIENQQQKPEFDRFVAQVKNGNSQQIVGVYIENVLALKVVQQPPDDANYVSSVKGVATQFLLAYQVANNIGLLAHNYLSGSLFFNIKPGDIALLVYGDGNVQEYEVTEYREYQALTPDSPNSEFIDLKTGQKITAGELFNLIYTGSHRLVFQTCIAQDNIDTWGRLFVLSFPY